MAYFLLFGPLCDSPLQDRLCRPAGFRSPPRQGGMTLLSTRACVVSAKSRDGRPSRCTRRRTLSDSSFLDPRKSFRRRGFFHPAVIFNRVAFLSGGNVCSIKRTIVSRRSSARRAFHRIIKSSEERGGEEGERAASPKSGVIRACRPGEKGAESSWGGGGRGRGHCYPNLFECCATARLKRVKQPFNERSLMPYRR